MIRPRPTPLPTSREEALEELIYQGTMAPRRRKSDRAAAGTPESKEEARTSSVSLTALLRMIRIIVWEWEKNLGWRDQHSLKASRLCRMVGFQAGLPKRALVNIKLAAMLHEVGMPAGQHLTAMSVAETAGYGARAQGALDQLGDLLHAVTLPRSVKEILTSQFEQPGGQGTPGRVAGTSLSQEATILSVVDSYLDLMDNPATPGGKCDTRKEALRRLRGAGERQRLCPLTVELLHQVVSPAAIHARLRGELATVLLVDPAREAHLGLVGALRSEQAEVRAVIDPARAARVALAEEVDLVICELDLKPLDGLEMIRRLRSHPRTRDLPVLLVVQGINDLQMDEARNLGVVDVMFKPYSTEECLAQILPIIISRRASQRGLRRVAGSMSEIELTDVLHTLVERKKTGQLSIRLGRTEGLIRLEDGKVVEATFGDMDGEDAFNEMLALAEGDFLVEPPSSGE